MAKTLFKSDKGIRVKKLVRPNKFLLYYGNKQCMINGEYQDGFDTFEQAVNVAKNAKVDSFNKYYLYVDDKFLNNDKQENKKISQKEV